MSASLVSEAANISTIIASIVAVIALIAGAIQFIATQKSSRETQAVDLFIKFNNLNIEQSHSTRTEESDYWYDNSKFVITESLYNITYNSVSWVDTVKWMLNQQANFIKKTSFVVDSYSEKFLEFCKQNGHELKP